MKISDYVMNFISGLGVKHVFYISGGGAMHLNDSLGRNENLKGICMLHEQGASIAAEAYARINEGYGVCLVTSGPGATNAVTGLAGAYYDSTPVIFISGQAKRADLVNNQNIRQFGIQETDIVSIAKPITKYAVQIKEPEDIRYELEKAAAIAVNGKPGPVWLDIPLDIQATQIDIKSLTGYDVSELKEYPCNKEDIDRTIELFNRAKRPALILGNGIRLAGGVEEARELYELLNVPVMTSWNGVDLIEDTHSLFCGRPGAVGHRHSNFIQQNADFVLTIGTRLNLLSTGYNFESFLENANHVMVEIDENEMKKKSVHPTLAINCDAKAFIEALLQRKNELNTEIRTEWIEHCNKLRDKYPRFIPEQAARDGFVSTYRLVDEISNQMNENDIYQFTSSGTSVDIAMKTFRIKKGQRAFLTKGLAAMGYDLPASIGSCIASGKKRTVCVTGDGSVVMNIQELEVLKRLQLPIKLFVVDNNGYSMIYGSQNGNFKGHLTGCTQESGLTLPDVKKLAEAFGIKGYHIDNESELADKITEVLEYDGPVVCTVKADIMQQILPKQTNYMREDGQMASRPLEDMSPLLDRDEFEDNLI
ncbi:thiamine pyrophosphate-binding protein [Clostridium beijerinckii]|uniref:thiamine pyrophosphate-binding protein n=1 Tax=Clostridium beijerinckii TaxID=1520 RepID=UPI00047D1058|nr:thiamine pyrophosphate-binding protein [Clostridium beijerinckii]